MSLKYAFLQMVFAVVASNASLVFAQALPPGGKSNYPNKPIRLVIGYPAGGAVDLVARTLASKLSDRFAQPVIVENRTGASGNIATGLVAKSAPDGYTLLLGTNNDSVSPSLRSDLPFELLRDLSPVTLVVDFPFYVVVRPTLPVNSVRELISLAKERPGELNFGSSGNGSSPHLAGEMLKGMAGIQILHVPYRGAPDALLGMISGQVDLGFLTGEPALPFVRAGKLRALAVTGARRAPQAPELPTLNESGLPGYELKGWHGILVPSGTPFQVVTALSQEVNSILALEEVRGRFARQGLDVVSPTSPQQFRAFIESDMEKLARIVREANVKLVN